MKQKRRRQNGGCKKNCADPEFVARYKQDASRQVENYPQNTDASGIWKSKKPDYAAGVLEMSDLTEADCKKRQGYQDSAEKKQ